MKLTSRDAPRYFAAPNPDAAGVLLYGSDPMRIALRRQEVIKALIGPEGEAEMRLTRMSASELRKDPAQVLDALRAVSFFPGAHVVFVEEATETAAPALLRALQDWQAGDAQLIVTAGALKPSSKLRKGFEADRAAYAIGIYDDPMSRQEIEKALSEAGLPLPGTEIMAQLTGLARALDPGDFRQTLEKIALYKLNDASPLSAQDVEACAPQSAEAELDEILNFAAEAQVQNIGPILQRLHAQGTNPVALMIAATRHFRTLHAAATSPQGIASVRPPVFGPRRERMARQAQNWGMHKLETALSVLTETDLSLRSAGQTAPQMAVVERAFIRLAMLGSRR